MKTPTDEFLFAMANALQEAEHGEVAAHMAAGMIWAMYPEWFEKSLKGKVEGGYS